MRKVPVAFSLLLLSLASSAQSDTPSRQITLRNLTLSGETQISAADQRQIASEVESCRVSANPLDGISERVRYVFQQRGYFKAWVAHPTVTVVTSGSADETVDVAIAVIAGEQYRLKEINFSGNRAFAASELRQTFPISNGEIFDTEKIRRGLELLRKLYVSLGYVNATPVPEIEADDVAHTVALRVDVDEGADFRLGSLVLDGVEPAPGAGARLMRAWTSYEGRVYSEEIIDSFIRENAAYLPPHATAWQLFEMRQDGPLHLLNFRLELGDGSENTR
jgi:outer membrane translocation and assembly module TamA